MTVRKLLILLAVAAAAIGGYYVATSMYSTQLPDGSPITQTLPPSAPGKENLFVEYYKQWNYPGHPDHEKFFVNKDGMFTYDLQTDYSTKPESRTLTAGERQQLDELIAAVRAEPLPTNQEEFDSRTISGTIRIYTEPKYRLSFLDGKAPTDAVKNLVDFLIGIKAQK